MSEEMTHPLTPREKVDVRGIALAAMTEMRRSGESYEMCARWISERVNAALASGSGDHSGGVTDMTDHAELARLAEAADKPFPPRNRARWWGCKSRFEAAFNPARVLALLAEIAALRVERDSNWEEYLAERQSRMDHGSREAGFLDQIDKLNSRATQAERQRDEAVADRDGWVDNYCGAMDDIDSLLKVLISRINGEKDLASAAEWVRLNYPIAAEAINASMEPKT